jgi:stage IV sporulation protein FB
LKQATLNDPVLHLAQTEILAYSEVSMIRFTLFGIPVEIQPFFWLTLVILGGATGADSSSQLFEVVLFVLAGFISILTHELGHALTARAYGAESRITLQAFGGYAAYSGVRMSRKQSFLVTAAGPAIQILLGLVVLLILKFIPNASSDGKYFMTLLIAISFFWAILNLLPVLPLDGGQMLNAVLGPARIQFTLWTSIVVAIAAGAGIYLVFGSFIFPIFLLMFAWQAYQALRESRLP